MLWWHHLCHVTAHPGKSYFEACSHAITWMCVCQWLWTSTHPFWASAHYQEQLMYQDADKVVTALLSQKLKFIQGFCDFPHTPSTGWSQVLLECQIRTSASVYHSSAGALSTSVEQTRPHWHHVKPWAFRAELNGRALGTQGECVTDESGDHFCPVGRQGRTKTIKL